MPFVKQANYVILCWNENFTYGEALVMAEGR